MQQYVLEYVQVKFRLKLLVKKYLSIFHPAYQQRDCCAAVLSCHVAFGELKGFLFFFSGTKSMHAKYEKNPGLKYFRPGSYTTFLLCSIQLN